MVSARGGDFFNYFDQIGKRIGFFFNTWYCRLQKISTAAWSLSPMLMKMHKIIRAYKKITD